MNIELARLGVLTILILAILQIIAWISGYNGQVFTFVSMLITGIAAAIFGIAYQKSKT